MAKHMLSTIDNPFNPFTHYDEWFAFDASHRYHTPSFLDRVSISSDDLSESDQLVALENAIDEIVSENVSGMYIKVSDSEEV